MSCYNWERGTIKIPAKEWKGLRDTVVRAANERNARNYQSALKIHAALKDKAIRDKAKDAVRRFNKGKPKKEQIKLRDVTPQALFGALNDSHGGGWKLAQALTDISGLDSVRVPNKTRQRRGGVYFGYMETRNEDWYDDYRDISNSLFPVEWVDGERVEKKLQKPKKKDFPKIAATKVERLRADCGTVYFNHKDKTVTWDVDENNRAVESARGTWLAETLFRALNQIKWTRGSGGKIVGNDEYNRDSDYEGGGGNYINDEYGPEAQKRRKLAAQNITRW